MLVGFDHADDAGVYLLTPETALVQTVDFFTPIVDDPYTFGQIAATNALSDVYAMGGKPLTSLALVCFPEKGDLEILERILAGGLSKMIEAGCTVVGGHSIRDEETKFGYSVTGVIHPKRVLANQGAQPGDRLLFTKALGTGVISTAIKKGVARAGVDRRGREVDDYFEQGGGRGDHQCSVWRTGVSPVRAERSSAGQPRAAVPTWSVHALTDITGFGLIGHAREMALASDVSLVFIPPTSLCSKARSTASAPATFPAASKPTVSLPSAWSDTIQSVPDEVHTLLFDPQTAGGLLISVAAEDAGPLTRALQGCRGSRRRNRRSDAAH